MEEGGSSKNVREGEGSQRRSKGAGGKTGERDKRRRFIGAMDRQGGGADKGRAHGKLWGRAASTSDSRAATGEQRGKGRAVL